MTFDRNYRGKDGAVKILGVGNKIVNLAIRQARESKASLMTAKGLKRPLYIFRIIDRVTDTGGAIRSIVAAISPKENGDDLLRDWELVEEMNSISLLPGVKKAEASLPPDHVENVNTEISRIAAVIESRLDELALPFKIPSCELLALILPQVVNQ